jgi:DegT/DnrJ/EryC1/StrS aminotransferase family
MAVPLLDLRAQYAPIRADILDAIARVCDSQQFILGAEVESLERELASALSARHAIGVSSGTDALLLALMALDVKPADEVIVPALSFFATAGSVARLGATPVFGDIDPITFNLDPAGVDALVSPRTRAIMPVHLYGLPADLDRILAVGTRRGVPIVEDAAQAVGARYRGRPVGSHRGRAGGEGRPPAESWRRAPLFPSGGRRQFQARRAAGGGPARQAPASGSVDGVPACERRSLSCAFCALSARQGRDRWSRPAV